MTEQDNVLPGTKTFRCGTGEMGTFYWSKDSTTSDIDHTLWDDIVRAVCLLCGKLTRAHKPEEVPLCEKCSNQDSEAAD